MAWFSKGVPHLAKGGAERPTSPVLKSVSLAVHRTRDEIPNRSNRHLREVRGSLLKGSREQECAQGGFRTSLMALSQMDVSLGYLVRVCRFHFTLVISYRASPTCHLRWR